MKLQIIALTLLISAFTTATFANHTDDIVSGNSHTEFGEYLLTGGDNYQVINNVAYRTWELKYPETGKTFVVYMTPGSEKNCCFIVRGENFEIQYSKNENGFGAKMVDSSMRTISRKELLKKIDRHSLQGQEILTQNTLTVDEYLGMIACFMPLLFG